MDTAVKIKFSFNGTHFKGEAFAAEDGRYRVEYKSAGLELSPRIIYVEKTGETEFESSSWRQVPEPALPLDDEFLVAVGKAIEEAIE